MKSVIQETEPDMEKQYANESQWKMLCGGGLYLPGLGCGLRVGSCKHSNETSGSIEERSFRFYDTIVHNNYNLHLFVHSISSVKI